jgi:UDP-glucuronate 4-epimerase
MRIFVSGASGFIGSAVCSKFASEGHQVLGIDSNTNYYSPELKKLRVAKFLSASGVEFRELDICDFDKLDQLISSYQPEVIINLAAQAGVRLSTADSSKYVDSNLTGFSNILRSATLNSVPNFLYASSSSVYGNNSQVPYSEKERNLNPTSFYGATKLANEILAPALVRGSKTRTRGMRFFTVYGPWGRPDMAYFRMISNVLTGSAFTFFGDGSVQRDFTFIDDTVKSIYSLALELTTNNHTFSDIVNLGGGRPLSMNYLVNLIEETLGKNVDYDVKQENINDVVQTVADTNYLKKLIGYQPETKLEEGIQRTIEWASSAGIKTKLSEWVTSSK